MKEKSKQRIRGDTPQTEEVRDGADDSGFILFHILESRNRIRENIKIK